MGKFCGQKCPYISGAGAYWPLDGNNWFWATWTIDGNTGNIGFWATWPQAGNIRS